MADELTNSRAILQRQHRDAQGALQDLLSEREQLRQGMKATHTYGPFTSRLFFYAPAVPSMWRFYTVAAFIACLVYTWVASQNRCSGEGG